MPRLDDPTIKLKEVKNFKRKRLRPWDRLEDFEPTNKLTLEEIIEHKGNNKETISKQLVNNLKNNKETIIQHKGNNKETISKHNFQQKETISKPIGKQNGSFISKQLDNQLVNTETFEPSIFESVKRLCGLQRILLFYIVENCKSRGLLYTTPVTNETLRIVSGTDANSVKTSIQRLIMKRLTNRERGKRGKGGYSVFYITESIRNAVIELQRQYAFSKQLDNQLVNAFSKQLDNNWETNKETADSSSSSNNDINNKTTTTTVASNFELPPDWEEIDLNELQKRNVRFGKNHLVELFPFLKKHSAFEIQESIDGFIYDIDNNHIQARRGYLNFLIGIFRNSVLYTSAHYISSERQQIINSIKLANERKREREEYYRSLEDEEFYKWLEGYSEEKIMKELPVGMMVLFKARAKEAMEWIKINIYRKISSKT